MTTYTRQEQAAAYRHYCQAIVRTLPTASDYSDHIRETVRQSYKLLFNSDTIRQRNMTKQQLNRLCHHRIQMTELMSMTNA